ncbi:uncharacterized protein LOC123879272 [Maniola jurtina]|uniref:uncharacterized protein LOC123879272 n=1 Tax=Maniola jurtina TaxID=191418 RepID=UPI001E68A558|nr:uncharacterized protein LOC123879272 [Maniola jurtina]
MESPKIVYKYYSNPAFCAQSEVVFQKACVTKIVSPNRRMSPLGANSPRKMESNRILRTDISDNPLRMFQGRREEQGPPELPPKPPKYQFHRQASLVCKPSRSVVRCRTRSEDLEMAQFRQKQQVKYERNAESDDCLENNRSKNRYIKYNRSIDNDDLEENRLRHRYEIDDDGIDYSPTKKRIIEADESEIEEYNVDGPDENEMKEIPTEIVKTVNGKTHRYAIVPSDDEDTRRNVTFTSPQMSQKNLIATQKLHELLSTPRKLKSYASQPSVRITPNKLDSPRYPGTPMKIISSTPTQITPSKSCANLTLTRNSNTSPISPKAQQKLNYGVSDYDRQDVFVTSSRDKRERSFEMDRRESSRESRSDRRVEPRRDKNTAVIMPRVAAQSPSVYSEDTIYKSISSLKPNATAASLTIAALMLTLCGGLTTGLSFYMMYTMGRRYYLDFGVLSGFTCFLLGLLGFRSRRNQLLPNRNYISGYIVLSSFSLLSAFGLLILLVVQPKPGTALNDITSGAVCSISILSLCLASVGVLASYCCARDPPDNRVGTARWAKMADYQIREAAESLLSSVTIPASYRNMSHSQSVNLVTEDFVAGHRPQGRMSSVRRFFCLFVTFDLLFTSLMWLICVMMKGETLIQIFDREILHYSIKVSLFDIVIVAILRFLMLILFYAILYINNWSVIALSTGGTCAFLIGKVFVYDWPDASQPVYQVFLILTSFTLAWGEAWFLDFRVLPQEFQAKEFMGQAGPSERAPLLRASRPPRASTHGESTVNWFSPVETPEASPRLRRPGEQIILTQDQIDEYKALAEESMHNAFKTIHLPNWRLEKRGVQKGDVVESTQSEQFGKVYRFTGVVDCPATFMYEEFKNNLTKLPEWNPTILKSELIKEIGPGIDLSYQITAGGGRGIIAPRDFIILRRSAALNKEGQIDETNPYCYITSGVSVQVPGYPPAKDFVRGHNKVGCWCLTPKAVETAEGKIEQKAIFQWLMCCDLKGKIPQFVLDAAFATVMLDYIVHVRKFAADSKAKGLF